MRLSAIRLGVLLVPSCLVAAAAASAQPAPASPRLPQESLRSQISIMEGILERAVGEGIRGAIGQMPDLFQGPGPWITPPRARGFKVDGYGVFFDVEVPALPASIWSISLLNRNNEAALVNEISQMRALLQGVTDQNRRMELARALDRVQQRVSAAALSEPGAPPARATGAVSVAQRQDAPPAQQQAAPPRDPDVIYTGEVKKALVGVMLEQGITMQVAPDEWFTVAASQPRGGWGEPDTMTMYLSILGKDLTALRSRQITADEAAKRIVVKNY